MSLFHAGGAATAANHFPFSDGIGILRSSLTRLQHLDLTQLGSIIACAGIVPAAWRYIRHAWYETGSWIRHFFVSSVTIPAGDACNRNVSSWLLEHVIQPSSMRFFTAKTQVSSRDLEPGAALKKSSTREVQYIPHWTSTWFFHNSHLFLITRSLESLSTSLNNDPIYDGIGGEELSISCLGLSAQPIRDLISTTRTFADQISQFYVIIYSRDRYGMSWRPKFRKPLRRLDTVHIDQTTKQALVADIRNYLDPRTQTLYQSRSMPYRRGYLLSGPPGTGKSSLTAALAGEFGLDLYELKLPSIASDADLEQAFQEIPPRCIVLMEDVDCVWARDGGEKQRQQQQHLHDLDRDGSGSSNGCNSSSSSSSGSSSGGGGSGGSSASMAAVTLSGLLNVLDGVGSQEGRVLIMTTNKPSRLDPALIRPGRVDFKVRLGYISKICAEEMFLRMFRPEMMNWAKRVVVVGEEEEEKKKKNEHFGDGGGVGMGTANEGKVEGEGEKKVDVQGGTEEEEEEEEESSVRILAKEFAEKVPEGVITPSQLQGFFQIHLRSAGEAVRGIEGWVRGEIGQGGEGCGC